MNKCLPELLSRFKAEKNKVVRVSAGSLTIHDSNVGGGGEGFALIFMSQWIFSSHGFGD